MQIIKIIAAILMYVYAVSIFAAVQVVMAKGTFTARTTKSSTLFAIYAFVVLQIISATLLLVA